MLSVFPDRMNQIDPEDPEEALRTIDNYIRYMVDQVEFSLTNAFRTTSGLGTSSAEITLLLATLNKKLEAAVSTLNAVQAAVTGLQATAAEQAEELEAVQGTLGSHTEALEFLDHRVTALEHPEPDPEQEGGE